MRCRGRLFQLGIFRRPENTFLGELFSKSKAVSAMKKTVVVISEAFCSKTGQQRGDEFQRRMELYLKTALRGAGRE